MKRFLFIICLYGLSIAAFAQEEKHESHKVASPEMSALQTAAALAKYGYANYSATALVEAAKIFAETKIQPMGAEVERGRTETVSDKDNPVSFEPTRLLAEAKRIAGKDKVIRAYINQLAKSISSGGTRGAVGGPKGQNDRVLGMDVNSYKLKFWAGELAEVCVSGDSDTDLDLYVFDENGNLIVSDTDYTDVCVVRWVPAWTGTFIIKVANQGDEYNNYVIWTN